MFPFPASSQTTSQLHHRPSSAGVNCYKPARGMRAHEGKRSLFIVCLLACPWCCFPSAPSPRHSHARCPSTEMHRRAQECSSRSTEMHRRAQKCSSRSTEMLSQQLGPAHDTQPCHCPITPIPGTSFPSGTETPLLLYQHFNILITSFILLIS